MRKFNFTRILLLAISLIILILGVLVPNSNLVALALGVLAIISFVILDMQAPKIAKLSEDNPKVKTMRLINRLTTLIIIIGTIFTALAPVKNLFSQKTNELILIGLLSIFIMFFGNLAPKIPFNRYLGFRLPWTIRDEDTWKIAHKILGYLSFPIGIAMFILTFYFSPDKIAPICIIIWILIPGLYSLVFYCKKFKRLKD